ncbi:ankyrin repeat domain-containing protein [Actinoplanes lobatus]|nr:ankyrin repeat domain-containing protein [Actinoplanes lobatus]MBB4751782.1 ankyrin repeat protein [Actinoplanes lobatus]
MAAGTPELDTEDPLAVAVVAAIRTGDVARLRELLAERPDLATARIGDRTLLHVVTDWPGHYPDGPATVAALVEAGADVNARFTGSHAETPLHWAASCDDVAVLDALLDAGADIDAPGAVIAGGTPLDDATAFAQWRTARRLVERGAHVTLWHAATLGRLDLLHAAFDGPEPADVGDLFWGACHGGQLEAARFLLDRGADLDWIPRWENLTPLDAAIRGGDADVIAWLHERGAARAS